MFVLHGNAPLIPLTPRKGPLLLGCTDSDLKSDTNWRNLPEHRDEGQVKLDVERSFIYYPDGM